MKLIADLKAEHLDENRILEPVFKRGLMHWAHSEQLLLACLADHDADVRGRAVARIVQLRHESEEPPRKRGRPTASGLRVFQLPKPNWEATHYSNMIDWKAEQVYEPPYLRKFSTDQIREFEKLPLVLDVPSNSQHVERCIKLVTTNATCAGSAVLRDGLCHVTV